MQTHGNQLGYNGESNASDEEGTDNSWDDGVSLGNYWGDYDGTGVYTIPGSTGSVDRYPRKMTVTIPPEVLVVIVAACVIVVVALFLMPYLYATPVQAVLDPPGVGSTPPLVTTPSEWGYKINRI